MSNPGVGACVDCEDAATCEIDPANGAAVCAQYLARAVAPASLEDTLRSLESAGAIRGFTIEGKMVRLDADLTALELAVLPAMDRPAMGAGHFDGIEPRGYERAGVLAELGGDGFTVSSDIGGRRGAPTARAADFEATRAYYAAASAFLVRSKSLKGKARRMWALHVKGLSEREIAARTGANRRKVQRQLDAIRLMAGIVTRRK